MVIRSGSMDAARSIFAEVCLPTGSKNAFLADLPPVSEAKRKSVRGIPQGGRETPLRFTSIIQVPKPVHRIQPFGGGLDAAGVGEEGDKEGSADQDVQDHQCEGDPVRPF